MEPEVRDATSVFKNNQSWVPIPIQSEYKILAGLVEQTLSIKYIDINMRTENIAHGETRCRVVEGGGC